MSGLRDASPDSQENAFENSAKMTKVSLYSSATRNQKATIYEDLDGEDRTHEDQRTDAESVNQ
jgi:hypothetical protein